MGSVLVLVYQVIWASVRVRGVMHSHRLSNQSEIAPILGQLLVLLLTVWIKFSRLGRYEAIEMMDYIFLVLGRYEAIERFD